MVTVPPKLKITLIAHSLQKKKNNSDDIHNFHLKESEVI